MSNYRSGGWSRQKWLLLLLLLVSFWCCVDASRHHHHHPRRAADTHDQGLASRQLVNSTSVDTGAVQKAEALIRKAHRALRVANSLRKSHIRFNKNEFRNASSFTKDPVPAPLLDLNLADDPESALNRRSNRRPGDDDFAYTLPDEIIEAARIVAAANPPKPSTGNHSTVANQIRAKYALKVNDTNPMRQALLHPNGLFGDIPLVDSPGPVVMGNRSETVKRALPGGWMGDMEPNGVSPFAPAGYKVWRNVKDFGARGDGVTDDTAAINLAILSGGRCGENCGSSTIFPAVVYFPAGTYLVSSSIIQYYNTQFLGDSTNPPTILAAASFVGLGVITSNVYTDAGDEQWYINQSNFLRSIRNFKIDIRQADLYAEVCAIHWQVAQGTSLENIEFYMSFEPGNNQQGIFMENGSGGFLSELIFVGGKFGAYFGNQQFTTSHLVFVNCQVGLQIHWDWAWTMQDVIIESCFQEGIKIVGGAGGVGSTGQGVGSLILADAIIANTPMGVNTSILAENSTSLLLQNVGFFNVQTAVYDSFLSRVVIPGGDEVRVDNWGFGMVNNASGQGTFINGQDIPPMNRSTSLTGTEAYATTNNLFTRRRPKYDDIGMSQIINIKALGAQGDGVSDDTVALNSIFASAANMSSVVFIPFGVYIITDTVKIPMGSRIIGQAWSQIMAKGPKFADMTKPHVAVQVGNVGDVGTIEIQDVMFTASGPTAGVVLVEWNVHESSQGSAGLWDSHFRIGGAIGTDLQRSDCPKLTGAVNPDCIAASLLLRLTQDSSAYLENVWVWVADHDLDILTQDQIDVYSARGVLIESQGPTWLYATASEHNVLYQYQLSEARDILLGMIQTESPYYQADPPAPAPFRNALNTFANDPSFSDCAVGDLRCAVSWALRIIDSSRIYILGAGLYSWFAEYSQTCLDTNNCQTKGLETEESHDVWIYNLVTKAIVEMVSPLGETPTYARDNANGFLSSVLAWLGGAQNTTGQRDFPGFQLYTLPYLENMGGLPNICITALTRTIKCFTLLQGFSTPAVRGSLDPELLEYVCDLGCETSLKEWFDTVSTSCDGVSLDGALPTILGGTIWAGWNETCFKDSASGSYCNNIIDDFTTVSNIMQMPDAELCSECYLTKLQMMQASPYSVYNDRYRNDLEYAQTRCGVSGPTDILPKPYTPETSPTPICGTGETYTTQAGDTCDSIALANGVSSAALALGNSMIARCTSIDAGLTLCLPMPCPTLYELQPNDNCTGIELAHGLASGSVRQYNSWLTYGCRNLQGVSDSYGSILCLGPQGGQFTGTAPVPGVSVHPGSSNGYADSLVAPPAGAVVAPGTTMNCGRWWEAGEGETCTMICIASRITTGLFLEVNPSLSGGDCSAALVVGSTYCVGPLWTWNSPDTTTTASTMSATSTS